MYSLTKLASNFNICDLTVMSNDEGKIILNLLNQHFEENEAYKYAINRVKASFKNYDTICFTSITELEWPIYLQIQKVKDDYYMIVILSYFYDPNSKSDLFTHNSGVLKSKITNEEIQKFDFLLDGMDGLENFTKKFSNYINNPILDKEEFMKYIQS